MVNGVHYIDGPTTKRPTAATSDALNCLRQEAAGDRDKNTLICSGPSLKVCLALSFLNNEKERKSLAWNCRRDGERSFAQSLKRKSQSINNRQLRAAIVVKLFNCSAFGCSLCGKLHLKLSAAFEGYMVWFMRCGMILNLWKLLLIQSGSYWGLVHCCTIFHLRSGLWNIDDQYRYPKDNTEII